MSGSAAAGGGIRERHGRPGGTGISVPRMTLEEPPQRRQHRRQDHPTSIMRHASNGNNNNKTVDDADVAAGLHPPSPPPPPSKSADNHNHVVVGFAAEPPTRTASGRSVLSSNSSHVMTAPPSSLQSIASLNTQIEHHPSDLEFFEDLVSEPVLLLGVDISHLDRKSQFLVCATGVFGFSLLYGYLQELISVELCDRRLGLFLAMMQFSGYTLLAYVLRNFVYHRQQQQLQKARQQASAASSSFPTPMVVPFLLYLGLSLLRAIDLGMTNLAMQYINYPAKTLMKSSRVVFTMLFGVVIARKVYQTVDYVIVMGMVAGLALFMHADANSSAVFDWAGVAMLTVSLLCDGAISNMSETIMNRYGVGQDEFIFRMYSIALVAITVAAAAKGDLREGLVFMAQPGSYGHEMTLPVEQRTWSVPGKVAVMVLFSSMGFFGSSCSAAITKNFGALTMSITSTARKATTLFLSFFLFRNVCTLEHLMGVLLFIASLTAKSLRRGDKQNNRHHRRQRQKRAYEQRVRPPMSELETRALHHGGNHSDSEIEGSVVTLKGMEEGDHPSSARPLSPPTSTISNLSDRPAILVPPRLGKSGRRQRRATSASASPVQVL